MSDSRPKLANREFICMWKCGICVSVCEANAISHGSEVFEIDREACSGCLLCARTCPAGIIEEKIIA